MCKTERKRVRVTGSERTKKKRTIKHKRDTDIKGGKKLNRGEGDKGRR